MPEMAEMSGCLVWGERLSEREIASSLKRTVHVVRVKVGTLVQDDPFRPRAAADAAQHMSQEVHILRDKIVCDTDARGYESPQNRGPLDIVVDASEGFIPLWSPNSTLRWRFQKRSLEFFQDPSAAAASIRQLLGKALLAWGDAVPVKFANRNDRWDFEIVMRGVDDCSPNGCVLASAFFPDAGRHELVIYPKMFTQSEKEQVDTVTHELGHTFGLRHFFALLKESAWPAQIFGKHDAFSIMNYGNMSELTAADKSDLTSLYRHAWSGELTQINGTPIKFVTPFSSSPPVPLRVRV
jgi:hypothetical protein